MYGRRALARPGQYLARLLRALRERIESLGVVPGQFAQLLALYEQDGLTQAELCAHVEIERPTMARTLSRMQRDGLIDRVPDPADGRRSLVTLTLGPASSFPLRVP